MSSTQALQKRLAKLKAKKDKGKYWGGKSKCEIVGELPKHPDPDTFYIVLV